MAGQGVKDQNDPFETHKKAGVFGSIWGSKQPAKKAPTAAGGGAGYKSDKNLPPPPSFQRLFLFPLSFFIVTALSFTIFWELNKAVPIIIAMIMLCFVFDNSSLGEVKDSRGEEVHGLLPSLSGPDGVKAMRVWLRVVVAWLAVFLGAVTGMNADESYMAQFYVISFGREYENVLASTPGAAYSDAGKVFFAQSSSVAPEKCIGFKEKLVYCAAPIIDTNQGRKSVAFWAIGYDCCDARGKFNCGAGPHHHSGVRAPPDGLFAQDRAMFLKAVNQSAAVNKLDVDEDVILLHWVKDPDSEAMEKFFAAITACLIGAGLFALLSLVVIGIGLFAEHEYTEGQTHKSLQEDVLS